MIDAITKPPTVTPEMVDAGMPGLQLLMMATKTGVEIDLRKLLELIYLAMDDTRFAAGNVQAAAAPKPARRRARS